MPYWLKNQDRVLTGKVPFRVVLGNPSGVAMKYQRQPPSITGVLRRRSGARFDIGA